MTELNAFIVEQLKDDELQKYEVFIEAEKLLLEFYICKDSRRNKILDIGKKYISKFAFKSKVLQHKRQNLR